MNLVGKILTVLIFVMTLLLMGFAVSVYSTHKNWRRVVDNPQSQVTPQYPLGLSQQLTKLRQDNVQLKEQRDQLAVGLSKEQKARESVLAKLETKIDQKDQELNRLRNKEKDLVTERREAVAATAATQKELEDLRGKIAGLRQQKLQAEREKDGWYQKVLQLTEQMHETVNDLKTLRESQQTLKQDHDKALQVLRHFRLEPEPALYRGQPPEVYGVVKDIVANNLVEISIGSDDGLLKGHKLEVVRGAKYVGRIEVVQTDPDRAVCSILPNFQKSSPQRGDRVASQLLQLH